MKKYRFIGVPKQGRKGRRGQMKSIRVGSVGKSVRHPR